MGKLVVLRNYQEEALKALIIKYREGCRRQLISLPTGSGKTVIAAAIASRWIGPKMFLVHRDELMKQTEEKLRMLGDAWSIGFEQANLTSDPSKDEVIIASVPSLGRAGSSRIEKFDPHDPWLIISDEAHHACAKSYTNIYEYFGMMPGQEDLGLCDNKLHVGITATPKRADNIGLSNVFSEIVYKRTILEMIKEGWLVDIKAYLIKSDVDLSGVKVSAGDYAVGELANTVDTDARNTLAIESYTEKAGGSKALVFCVNVEHTQHVCKAFNRAGIPAEYIVGSTPKVIRRELISQFKRGDFNVLVGCEVFTEGFDVPDIETIIMLRPTKSGLMYIQMLGRGLRLCKGKSKCVLLDITDNSWKHPAVSVNSLIGLPANLKLNDESLLDASNTYDQLKAGSYIDDPSLVLNKYGDMSLDELKQMMQSQDIFNLADVIVRKGVPPELEGMTNYSWYKEADDNFAIRVKDCGIFRIRGNSIGSWETAFQFDRKLGEEVIKLHPLNGFDFSTLSDKDINKALHAMDSIISRQNTSVLYNINASWRSKEASEKQKDMLVKMGMTIPANLSKGEASLLLDACFRNKRRGTWNTPRHK